MAKLFRKIFRPLRLQDPRADNARHDLLEILFIALAAVLCGAESCSDMAEFGRSKEGLLRLFLRLEHGIPSHDTFSRVFRLLKPLAFELAFRRFMAAFAKANGFKLTGVVAVDGKALRGAFERGGRATPLQLVNVFAVEARMALAQQKAPGRNETAGALEVLDLLSLGGCIVTADALHCNRAFAAAVLDRDGHYVLAIKANRGPLFTAVTQQFARSGKRSLAEQINLSSHDRRETRRATVMRNTSLAANHHFPGVVAIGRVTSRRRVRGHRADPPVVRYYLLSKYMSPKRLLHVTRSHWGIENQLHWVLDVYFAEDANRARKDHAPENLAILRRLALNILRSFPDRASIRRKIKRAGWDNAFLLALLSHMR
jgi:predicted transposase YbfD/YdcC